MSRKVSIALFAAAILILIGLHEQDIELRENHLREAAVDRTGKNETWPGIVPPAFGAPMEQNIDTRAAYKTAVRSRGRDYLDAELVLREGNLDVLKVLQEESNSPDVVAKLISVALSGWFEGGRSDYVAALNYLDTLPAMIAATPLVSPPPLGVAGYLSEHYQDRVADFLMLRLLKASDWPGWKVLGVIFYLDEQKLPSTVAALLRFAVETQNEEWQGYAIRAAKSAKDPALKAKVLAERAHAESLGKLFPQALRALIEK